MGADKEIVSTNTQKPRHPRAGGAYLKLPSIIVLFIWSVIPLLMTLWFSFRRYDLMEPDQKGFDGFGNYRYLFSDPGLLVSIWHTVLLVGAVLVITIGLGTLLAVLFNQEFFWARHRARADACSFLCNAYSERPSLEKHDAAS